MKATLTLMLALSDNSSMLVTSNIDVTQVLMLKNTDLVAGNSSSMSCVSNGSNTKSLSHSNSHHLKVLPLQDLSLKANLWNSHRGQRKGHVFRIARTPQP